MTAAQALTAPTTARSEPFVIDRRRLLFGGAALAGLALVGRGVPLITEAVSDDAGSTGGLTAASFAPHVGTLFGVRAAGVGAVSLRLIEATSSPSHPSEPTLLSGSAYTLIFEGPPEALVPTGSYRLRHPVLDLPPLHLFPIGRTVRVRDYQIIVDTRTFESGTTPRKAG